MRRKRFVVPSLASLLAVAACSTPFSASSESQALDGGGHGPKDAGSSSTGDANTLRDGSSGGTMDAGTSRVDGGSDASSPGPTIPTDGLLLWLRADRGVTEANGGVSIWTDQSPNHADALQTASNLRPVLRKDGIAGHPALEFDGADDYMRLPDGFSDFSLGVSMFAVIQATTANACAAVAELSNGSEIDDISLGLYMGSITYEVLTGTHQGGNFVFDAPQQIGVVHRPDLTLQVRRNGGSEGEDTFDLPVTVTRTQNFVGRTLYGNCTTFSGLIGEILVYDRAVTDRELLDIEAILTTRFQCCTN